MMMLLGVVGSWMLTAALFWLIGRWDAVLPFPGDGLFVAGWVVAWVRGRLRDFYTDSRGTEQAQVQLATGTAWLIMWGATAWILFAAWETPPL